MQYPFTRASLRLWAKLSAYNIATSINYLQNLPPHSSYIINTHNPTTFSFTPFVPNLLVLLMFLKAKITKQFDTEIVYHSRVICIVVEGEGIGALIGFDIHVKLCERSFNGQRLFLYVPLFNTHGRLRHIKPYL